MEEKREKAIDYAAERAKLLPKDYRFQPRIIRSDDRIAVHCSNDRYAAEGIQPFLLCTGGGTLYLQTQLNDKNNSKRGMAYPFRLGSFVSRDGGQSFEQVHIVPDGDDPYFEGGMEELNPGEILLLDTYILPDPDRKGYGRGELWTTEDDFRSFHIKERPEFYMPEYDYEGTTDDGGRPHRAARLHRNIVKLPNGKYLCQVYGCFYADIARAAYAPTMRKMRTVVLESEDNCRTWKYLSTVAVDAGIGTEGFGEPTLTYLSKGPHAGRLLCVMRTGRALYRSFSDDGGKTWSVYRPLELPGLDPYAVKDWEEEFRGVRTDSPVLRLSLQGTFVDPELIQMQNGIVALAFGLRISEKLCWDHPQNPLNGNYVAFSLDGGDSFTHILQLTSGVLTTHYMGLREYQPGRLTAAYDLGAWTIPGSHSRVVDLLVHGAAL